MFTKSNKSQLQIGETMLALIVVLILLIAGFVMYAGFASSSIKSQGQSLRQTEAHSLALRGANLYELYCTEDGVVSFGCYDLQKVEALKVLVDEDTAVKFHYQSIFKNAELNVHLVYPDSNSYTIYSDELAEKDQIVAAIVPIEVYDPISDINHFGYVEVKKFY